MTTHSTKIVALVSFATFLAAAGTAAGVFYTITMKERALEERLTARAERAAAERDSAALEMLMKRTEAERAELDNLILTDASIIEFLAYMEALYRERGLVAETRPLAVETIKDNKIFELLVLDVSLTGTFGGVTTMLAIFESLPYQSRLQSVAIERVGTEWRGTFKVFVTKYKSS